MSKQTILQNISKSKPDFQPLPNFDFDAVIQYENVVEQFKTVLQSIGGSVQQISDLNLLATEIVQKKQDGKSVIDAITGISAPIENIESETATSLQHVHLAYLEGTVGVAENGSIWLTEQQMQNRILPFICEHLVLVLNIKNIVPTMHHAYKLIDVAKEGFGVFIAGPSKTADIEQSLVIGAHGPRSLKVYLID